MPWIWRWHRAVAGTESLRAPRASNKEWIMGLRHVWRRKSALAQGITLPAGARVAFWFLAMAFALGCDAELEIREPLAISKVAPSAVSSPDAWRLFDRSIQSAFQPGNERVAVTLDRAVAIAAIKLYGPAPYRIEVRGEGGFALGFDRVDMTTLTPGWHVITPLVATPARRVEIGFEAVGAGGGVPEIELWAQDDHAAVASSVDRTASELPAGLASFTADAASGELAPGRCTR